MGGDWFSENYKFTSRNNPEEPRSHLHRGGSDVTRQFFLLYMKIKNPKYINCRFFDGQLYRIVQFRYQAILSHFQINAAWCQNIRMAYFAWLLHSKHYFFCIHSVLNQWEKMCIKMVIMKLNKTPGTIYWQKKYYDILASLWAVSALRIERCRHKIRWISLYDLKITPMHFVQISNAQTYTGSLYYPSLRSSKN